MPNQRRKRAFAAVAAMAVAAAFVPGCFDVAGLGDFTLREPIHQPLAQSIFVDKLDLLLVVDNSTTALDLQDVLSSTFVDFFSRLANPPCLDADRVPVFVSGPLDACPVGTNRASPPLVDIHVGIITSSLGGHGSTACSSFPSQNTKAHLEPGKPDQSYQGLGFFAWDPEARLDPPGDSDLSVLVGRVTDTVGGLTGAGIEESGCGFEAPLEAWYRFLIDPNPHDTIEVDFATQNATVLGTDQTLLDQRAAFLRDDSMVAIVLLSDENDCSLVDGGKSHLMLEPSPYFNARAACATSPNDPCCTSCGVPPGEGCDTSQDRCDINAPNDDFRLRCFDQKRRFGVDFLHPIERYYDGLTQVTITDRDGVEQPNPLFAGGRHPSFVTFTAIVGVPWQDIARRDAQGQPDLINGLDAAGEPAGGTLNADELETLGVWDLILGDPASYVPPSDPFMVESGARRTGSNPITGDPITGPGEAPNGINGFDFDPEDPFEELQYACIAPLTVPVTADPECADFLPPDPTCLDGDRIAKWAMPGVRQIDLVRRLGTRGALGSACWPQLSDAAASDYGYRPALVGSAGLSGRLQDQLSGLTCIPFSLPIDQQQQAQCEIVEALVVGTNEGCDCGGPARREPGDADLEMIDRVKASPQADPAWNCFCFVQQPDQQIDRDACLGYESKPVVNEVGQRVDAWCYLDATTLPLIGNPALVELCEGRKLIRFVGEAAPRPGASIFLDCP